MKRSFYSPLWFRKPLWLPTVFYSAVHYCQPFFNLGSFGALRMANLRLSQLVANSTNFSYTCNNYCENHSKY